ncbi:MAG: sensor histidine kinase [Arachnia sp.]
MLRREVIGSGGVEALTAIMLFALSAYAALVGRIPIVILALDAAALAVVLVSLRWLRVGIAASIVTIAGVLVFDPHALGIALYLCMLPVVAAIRQDRLPLAAVATAINGMAGWTVSYRLTGDDNNAVGPMLSWILLYGIAWAIGLGFLAAGRSAEERVATQFRQRQIQMASELHDSVARDLSVLAMQADAARLAGSATPAELDLIAEYARIANRSIREVTRLLGGADQTAVPVATVRTALSGGYLELERLGFSVDVTGEIGPELPMTIAVGSGRILQEALHNVAKHGDPSVGCSVSLHRTTDAFQITVSNAPMAEPAAHGKGWGLAGMCHRAEAIGGSVDSRKVNDAWVCNIGLPLTTREPAARHS